MYECVCECVGEITVTKCGITSILCHIHNIYISWFFFHNLRILEPEGVREAAIKGVATAPARGAEEKKRSE